jgi:parallel beta-helix repeat protein
MQMPPRFVWLLLVVSLIGCRESQPSELDARQAALALSPRDAAVVAGSFLQLIPTAYDGSGRIIPDATVNWSSSDTLVATVDVDGTVFGRAPGSTHITAVHGGATGAAVVRVTRSPDFVAIARGIRPRGFGQGTYAVLLPAAGGTRYWVATTGSDTNSGTSAEPFRTINHAAQVAVAGDVVTIRAGTYEETVQVKNSGTASRRIVFQAERRGEVLLTGGSHSFGPAYWTGNMTATGEFFVTLRGLVFRHYALPAGYTCSSCPYAPAVRAAQGWRIEDCWFDRAGEPGTDIRGSHVEVLRSTFTEHIVHGMTAAGISRGATTPSDPGFTPLEGLRVVDVVLTGNHTRTSQPGSPTASFVAKFLNTRGTVLDNIESYANNGAGFWLDARNINYVIRHSYFHDNRSQTGSTTDGGGRGIYTEINWPAGLIESNVFTGNFGPAIDVANSSGITIRHNLFSGNISAVRMSEWDRGYHADGTPVYPLQDITIVHNQIRDWNSASGSIHSSASKTGFRLPVSHGILADYNVYEPLRRTTPLAFWWNTAEGAPVAHMNTIEDMRGKAGWEQNGRIGVIHVP